MNYLRSEGLFGQGCTYVCDVCLNFALEKLQPGNIIDASRALDESASSMNVSDAEIMDISSTHDEVLDEAPPLDEVEPTCVLMSSTIGTQYEVELEEIGDTFG